MGNVVVPLAGTRGAAVERLSEIHIPTLIIVGDEDALMLHQIAD